MTKPPKYTDEEKREIVAYAVRHSSAAAARKFGCSPSSVRNWKKAHAPGDRVTEGRNPDGTFTKGISGNPDGISSAQRRARELAAQASERILEVYLEEFDHIATKKAGKRDLEDLFAVGDRLLDRGIGRPKQTTAIEGGEKPVQMVPVSPKDLSTATLRDLVEARARALAAGGGDGDGA